MFGIENYAGYLVASALLTIMPGVDSLFVLNKALGYGRRAGFTATAGITLGNMVHITLAAFGLSLIIARSPVAYAVLKYLGTGYLAWLGASILWKTLRGRRKRGGASDGARRTEPTGSPDGACGAGATAQERAAQDLKASDSSFLAAWRESAGSADGVCEQSVGGVRTEKQDQSVSDAASAVLGSASQTVSAVSGSQDEKQTISAAEDSSLTSQLTQSPTSRQTSPSVQSPLQPKISQRSQRGHFVSGLITNLLNPKIPIFFIAFIPQYIAPGAEGNPLPFILLGSTLALMGVVWFIVITLFASAVSGALRENRTVGFWLDVVTGVLFLALAAIFLLN